ncbi:ubiquitin-conjugating enzyme/RWD-like protein [Peziza echinospora]|nr:ubiquitin-conjugating enzyme/RWD-like protein [Peziza echinospora]
MASFATRRLQKELSKIVVGLPPGIKLISAEDFQAWQLDIQVLDDNPIYKGQTYRLNFRFTKNYPIDAPVVTFVQADGITIPIHPHIYSNGVICLDLLSSGHGWSPVQSVESVCMSIQSMLTGNTRNERPEGDAEFVSRGNTNPRNIRFVYDDPTV